MNIQQNLQQKIRTLLTASQKVIIQMKIQSNFQQIHQNQVFVFIQMLIFQLQEILMLKVVIIIQKWHLKIAHHLENAGQK